jgi:hypothetical protein
MTSAVEFSAVVWADTWAKDHVDAAAAHTRNATAREWFGDKMEAFIVLRGHGATMR